MLLQAESPLSSSIACRQPSALLNSVLWDSPELKKRFLKICLLMQSLEYIAGSSELGDEYFDLIKKFGTEEDLGYGYIAKQIANSMTYKLQENFILITEYLSSRESTKHFLRAFSISKQETLEIFEQIKA